MGSERIAASVFANDIQSRTSYFVAQTQDSDTLENASTHWQPDTQLDWSPDLKLIELQIWDQITVLRAVNQIVGHKLIDGIWTFIQNIWYFIF